mmetsp:Transcript_45579/g.110458  ORF Transcript_45579/g.110458 Transcript_45579/m.110458 type:complete len:265 (+) Transcript_45579:56-850(+)|eukprot:CAMPEP_0113614028 /NCGR_PEP_ID=MMETSP0017_2-20120614/6950_1 /TAXON_ID=2856 /ORGANISM="Cylindrotheca closterium" /LENGTH=264 /DNA_ID=CAMNT_0000523173 /DNA_START=34 /DNA_END=828 /DNA_ORIENTATION=+ /assembly_acc=CAM_ASM_000147
MPLFPYKLHELLTEMQANTHLSSIISWTHSGNAFKIHEPVLFEEILLQKYFPRQTRINSFKRQLLYYGFDNLGDCIFAHPCFLQDKRHLCGQINHTNPTKSQREAKASIPSRRIRGKRAKEALRERLEVSAASKVDTSVKEAPATSSVPAFIPSSDSFNSVASLPTPAPVGLLPFSNFLLQQQPSNVNQSWGRLNGSCSPQTIPSGMGTPLLEQPKQDQSYLPALAQVSMLQMNNMSGLSRMQLMNMLRQNGANAGTTLNAASA